MSRRPPPLTPSSSQSSTAARERPQVESLQAAPHPQGTAGRTERTIAAWHAAKPMKAPSLKQSQKSWLLIRRNRVSWPSQCRRRQTGPPGPIAERDRQQTTSRPGPQRSALCLSRLAHSPGKCWPHELWQHAVMLQTLEQRSERRMHSQSSAQRGEANQIEMSSLQYFANSSTVAAVDGCPLPPKVLIWRVFAPPSGW